MSLFTKAEGVVMKVTEKKRVFIKFSFPAFHCWPDAPKSCMYLQSTHRHVFHVKAYFDVTHNDRDIEFITKKQEVETYMREKYANQHMGKMSCEMLAEEIINRFNACKVEVSEDDENGAILEHSTEVCGQ